RRYGTDVGIPQVLLNYHPVSRGPWRLKALIDEHGHAVTSNFLVVRPRDDLWSLEAIWGLCNSPLANAYAYATLGKRDILTGTMRRMPVPDVKAVDIQPLTKAVRHYLH